MTMSDDRGNAAGYLGWFFFGAALGAAAALLMAPKTGQETRELLTQQSGEIAKKAQEFAVDAQGHAGEWLDKSRELFEEQTQRLLNAFEAGKDAKKLEHERDRHRNRDPYFDFAEVFLQIAIVTASVAILSTSRPMFGFSLVLAVIGAVLTANGFTQVFTLPFLHHGAGH